MRYFVTNMWTLDVSNGILAIALLATLLPSTSAVKAASATWRCTVYMMGPSGRKGKYSFQRLADHVDGVLPNDLFFDRLVYVHHEGKYDFITETNKSVNVEDLSVTLNGVIISERLILTSWNPFRNIMRFRFKRYFTSICATWKRRYESFKDNYPHYTMHEYTIDCARPVIPLHDDDVPIDLWHGHLNDPKMHSPIHDLVVFRVSEPIYGLSKVQLVMTTDYWRNLPKSQSVVVGPIMTYLANETDVLGRNLKFAMLGNNLSKNLFTRRNIYVREYEAEENVITDCDEWISRDWGWFICLRNLDDIPRLASGAMLYHNELLYGVGSFAIWKGNQSILVFTDVRKYKHLIYNTCTKEDQDFAPPKA